MSEMSYWLNTGKYQKSYNYFYQKLVPTKGKAQTPEGELLRIISKIYYRHFNDGDTYEFLLEEGYPSLKHSGVKEERMISEIESDLMYYTVCYEDALNKSIDRIMRYLILKHSTAEKIWNPATQKLVKVRTPQGMKILDSLDCQVKYDFTY
jgi:uncharacterized protein (UPF0332 family)